MSSLDRILPFLRPIEDLLVDPTVTEVMVELPLVVCRTDRYFPLPRLWPGQ